MIGRAGLTALPVTNCFEYHFQTNQKSMINRTKHSIASGLVTLVLLLSFLACTKENLQLQEKAIGFSHTGSDEWSIVGNTRSDDTQLTVGLDFGVYAFLLDKTGNTAPEYSPDGSTVIHMDNVHVSHNGTKYDYSPTRYWPGNIYWVQFFAYHPYSINEKTGCSVGINGGKPLIAYTNDASTDLMASAPDMFKVYIYFLPCSHFQADMSLA